MSISIWVFIIIVNLVLGYYRKTSYPILLATVGINIFFMSGNTEGPDVGNYINVYRHPENYEFSDFGYQFLEIFCGFILKIDFFTFRYIISVICFLLIFITIKRCRANGHFVMALFMMYLFFTETIQFRNFIVSSLFVFSFSYYIRGKKKDLFIYVIINLLAASIHIVALVNLLFLTPKIFNEKKSIKFFTTCGLIIFIMSVVCKVLGGNLMTFIINSLLSDSERGAGYARTETKLSWIALSFLYFGMLSLSRKAYYYSIVNHESFRVRTISHSTYQCSLIIIIFLGTLMLNVSFYRFFRNLLLLQFITISACINNYHIRKTNRKRLALGTIIFAILWFVIDIVMIEGYQECVDPIFLHNIAWEQV